MNNTHRLLVIAVCNFVVMGIYLWFLLSDADSVPWGVWMALAGALVLTTAMLMESNKRVNVEDR